jgi:putative tryptophan/tyrosine transport system substrate-binding protein
MKRREFMTFIAGAATSAIGWPLAVPAQQPGGKAFRIGYLALIPGEDRTLMRALLARLNELGYRQGVDLVVDYRSAEGHPERLRPLADELVEGRPDVLIAGFGTLAAQAAKTATTTIPVVFTTVGDPLGAGLIASLGRPGGNVTGLTDQARDLQGKRLQLLLGLLPDKSLPIGVLTNPDTPFSRLALEEAKTAAESLHLRLVVLEARTADEVAARFEDAMAAAAGGLLVLEDPLIYSIREKVAELAERHQLPAIYVYRDSAMAGGLMSYGPDRPHIYRRAAEYVDKILKGAKPADLAVEQPTNFEFVINLKTAKALGLVIADNLLALADEVIE